jgi:hypothetical protein
LNLADDGATITSHDSVDDCDIMVPCAENEHVVYPFCVACPRGSVNGAGDVPANGDTTCAPVLCGENEHVQGHACVACPQGSVTAPGMSAAGNDTECGSCSAIEGSGAFVGAGAPGGAAGQPGATTCDATIAARDATIALIKSTSVPLAGARLAVTSGATTLCLGLVPGSTEVVPTACAKASAFVFNQLRGSQLFVRPHGRPWECIAFNANMACDLVVEPCAAGHHRRQVWVADVASGTTTLKNRKTGTCAVARSMMAGAGVGSEDCGAAAESLGNFAIVA